MESAKEEEAPKAFNMGKKSEKLSLIAAFVSCYLLRTENPIATQPRNGKLFWQKIWTFVTDMKFCAFCNSLLVVGYVSACNRVNISYLIYKSFCSNRCALSTLSLRRFCCKLSLMHGPIAAVDLLGRLALLAARTRECVYCYSPRIIHLGNPPATRN